MSKIIETWEGPRETDYPAGAKCARESCGHPHGVHSYAANCGHCDGCESPNGELRWEAFHYFEPMRLAGGALTPEDEHAAYQAALRGDAA